MPPARPEGNQPQKPAEQKETLAPQNRVPSQDAAISKIEEVLAQIKRTGRPVINDPNAITNTKGEKEILKGNVQPAFITLEGPAMGHLSRLGDRRLSRTVEVLGRQVNRVKKVRCCVKPGTKTVFVWETDDEDTDGIDVKRYDNDTTVNFADLLIPLGLSVESGHYQKFALEFSEPTDTVYPALKFDMAKVLESGLTAAERKRRAAAGQAAPRTKRGKTEKAPEPGSEPGADSAKEE